MTLDLVDMSVRRGILRCLMTHCSGVVEETLGGQLSVATLQLTLHDFENHGSGDSAAATQRQPQEHHGGDCPAGPVGDVDQSFWA